MMADKRVGGVAVPFVDVSVRKKAEEVLRPGEEQFRRAIEDAPIPVIMQTEDGQVLQISRTWTEVSGQFRVFSTFALLKLDGKTSRAAVRYSSMYVLS